MLAVARQPAYASLPSFQDVEGPSELDDGLLDFALPPPSTVPMRRSFAADHTNSKLVVDSINSKSLATGHISKLDDGLQAPSSVSMRRSLRKIRSRQSSKTSAPIKRTLSQKRKRQQVCFAPNDQLSEIHTFEAVPEDCKETVWYSGKELSQQTYDELYRNWELQLERGCSHPLEDYSPDLTWRGLEDHIPDAQGEDGVAKRMEKIRQYVLLTLAIARTMDDDAEVAERAQGLSKSDRDEAIEKAQKDAYEAMREHGMEFGRPPVPHDCYKAGDDRRGSGASVLQALVTWFCSTDV